MDSGREIIARVAALARHSDSPEHYTRTYLTPAHRAAAKQIAEWMRETGMEVRLDAAGSVIGRYAAAKPGAKTLLMGSHFDSVRNGGRFDGVLGILVPIACIAELHRAGERLPIALEVAAFADEEGARFQTSFLASSAYIGRFDTALLDRRDADGITMREAMREAGLRESGETPAAGLGDPGQTPIPGSGSVPDLVAYVEVHIEQGPVLLDEGLALGVVTSIAAGKRHTVRVIGTAGHAGTVPMKMRHDALAAAAEMVLAVEERCANGEELVGTVGILRVHDGSSNVIPGNVEFTLDIRSPDDATHERAEREVFARFEEIARSRGARIERSATHRVHATPCAPWLQEQIAASVERCGVRALRLPSGAGHDAMVLAEVTDVGMLFVRCGAGGVSHNPAETVTAEDASLACSALLDFLRHFRRAR